MYNEFRIESFTIDSEEYLEKDDNDDNTYVGSYKIHVKKTKV